MGIVKDEIFREGVTEDTWVTSDGRKFKVEEMADRHLTNTVNAFRKTAADLLRDFGIRVTAKSVDRLLAEHVPTWKRLVDEVVSRGLTEYLNDDWKRRSK